MGKIVAFFGADHKCGTSMVAQSAAQVLAMQMKELNIILIHTENGTGNDYISMVFESLDTIKPYLEEKLLDIKGIVQRSRYKDNLFCISGTSKLGNTFSFHPDMGEYYVKKLAEEFDVVICDCGAEIEHGLSIGSLLSADFVYIVASQSEAALRRYEAFKVLFEKLNISPEKLIINKYNRQIPVSEKEIGERLNVKPEKMMTVRSSVYGYMAEVQLSSIIDCEDRYFEKDIKVLCRDIIARCGYAGI